MCELIIHMIRHGKTDSNTENLIAGVSDKPLNEIGKKEITRLISEGIYSEKVEFCFCSGLKRTFQTMRMIYPNVPFETEPLFNEINFGEYEDTCFEMFKTDEEYTKWITQDNSMSITAPGGEPIFIARKRLDLGLSKAVYRMNEKNIKEFAIFGHGNLFAEFTYVYLKDNRGIQTRIDSTFPNARGIKVKALFDKTNEINYELLGYIK